MSPQDRYDDFDELLRSALQDEADTITPGGDGLSRIQQRVQQRQTRGRWMRPAMAVSSAAALAVIGVTTAIVVGNSGDDTVKVGPVASSTTQPPSTEPIAATNFPAQAIFPFTSATAEQGWEQDLENGGSTWEGDPVEVAQHWVQDFLDLTDVDRVVEQTDDGADKLVTLGRVLQAEGHNLFKVTTVRMTPYQKAWIVTGASDPSGYLTFTSPAPGGTVVTPVTVTGPGYGVETAVKLDVRDATSATSYGTQGAFFGNDTGEWRESINFNRPSSPVGVLVGVEHSMADGGTSRIVAEQVLFSPAEPHQPPPYFYAVKNNRITKFASRTGDSIKYLTTEQPGGDVEDPQLYGTDVYFLEGGGTCANALVKVSTSADGTANGDIVASPQDGYVITSYAVGDAGVSTVETACDPARSPQARLVMTPTTGEQTLVDFDALPPQIVGDPSYELVGAKSMLAAFVRTGNAGYLARYAEAEHSTAPDRHACPGLGPEDGLPAALEVDANGTLWVALQTGSSMDVVRCGDNGKVWRWDGSGNPVELSPKLPLTHVTW